MMKPTVLLFDIDGTLVTTGGAGRRALTRAFHELYGRPDACDHFSLSGMTDRAIVRLGLEAVGVAATPAAIDSLLDAYLRVLEDEVAKTEARRYRVHAGMEQAVAAGHQHGYAVGLGTGNIRAGALAKLRRVGLDHKFDFGGFGDDHELRPELIRIGAQRGAERLGQRLEAVRIVVIGDTPKDIAAAAAVNAECLAVATGEFSVEALAREKPTFVFSDLTESGALEALLGQA